MSVGQLGERECPRTEAIEVPPRGGMLAALTSTTIF
jgi:hypothetical protein